MIPSSFLLVKNILKFAISHALLIRVPGRKWVIGVLMTQKATLSIFIPFLFLNLPK